MLLHVTCYPARNVWNIIPPIDRHWIIQLFAWLSKIWMIGQMDNASEKLDFPFHTVDYFYELCISCWLNWPLTSVLSVMMMTILQKALYMLMMKKQMTNSLVQSCHPVICDGRTLFDSARLPDHDLQGFVISPLVIPYHAFCYLLSCLISLLL